MLEYLKKNTEKFSKSFSVNKAVLSLYSSCFSMYKIYKIDHVKTKGVRKGVWVKPPLDLDILQKCYYLRKGA